MWLIFIDGAARMSGQWLNDRTPIVQLDSATTNISNLHLDVRLPTDGDLRPQVGVAPVTLQELVPAFQDLAEPLQNVGVVDYLVLDQLLGHREQHLGMRGTDKKTGKAKRFCS